MRADRSTRNVDTRFRTFGGSASDLRCPRCDYSRDVGYEPRQVCAHCRKFGGAISGVVAYHAGRS
jgi:hypothetical protein